MLRLRTFGGLWIENATDGAEGGPRPRRLALLAILAAAGPKGLTRERLLGILWPDSEPDRARHALSQTLYNLRRDVGADVVLATAQELRLDATQIGSDLADCRAAILSDDWTRAAELYQGPFLDGFYLADAPEFERWVDEERTVIATEAARAIESGARQATDRREFDRAAVLWRRLTTVEPLSGRFAAGYMQALIGTGERAGALAHAKAHEEAVRRELDADPDPAVTRLADQLRDSPPSALGTRHSAVDHAPSAERRVPRAENPSAATRVPRLALVAAAIIAVVAFVLLRPTASAPTAGPPILAVGNLRDLTTADSTPLGGVLSEMLTTSLARLTDIRVVAHSRILELMLPSDTSQRARTEAARRSGAKEILEGEVMTVGRDSLALALRRVDLASGVVRRGYRVTGVDRYALIDSVTTTIAKDLRLTAPSGALADVSTRSPIAYRLYEDGLRAYFQFDSRSAHQLFRAAVREDSTFAMATYYAWRTAAAENDPGLDSLGGRALQLASRATDRDRLIIIAHVGTAHSDLGALAAAESLATRYPSDPEALVRAAEVINTAHPDLSRTVPLLNRAVAIDSAATVPPVVALACRACEALRVLASQYHWADSIGLAEQTVRRWIAIHPSGSAPWVALADLALAMGRDAESARALLIADSLGRPTAAGSDLDLPWLLRGDKLALVDSRCRRDLPTAAPSTFGALRWWCTIALRMQGQYRAALRLAREGAIPGTSISRPSFGSEPIQAGWLDFEMGRPHAAGVQFQQLAANARAQLDAPGLVARQTAWNLTLAATAFVAGGDTSEAHLLADSVESAGRRSLFGRDPLLHHFIRGLVLTRAGDRQAAATAFRAALISPTFGFSRISYELGTTLLALGRPAEAIVVLRGPLHGGVDGSGLYLTRTEIHERLAEAFVAAGQRDSAAAHYGVVARAWRNADPILAARYQVARDFGSRPGR